MAITFTAGSGLDPEWRSNLAAMFQAAFLFSGVAVVAVAEYHIQRHELKGGGTLSLILVLSALVFGYYVASVIAAHADLANGWLVLAVWAIVFLGPAVRSKTELKVLAGSAAWLVIAALLILLVSNWLWPTFYYGQLFRNESRLPLTPYFMFTIGPVMWLGLLLFAKGMRNVTQQGVPADVARPAGERRG